MHKGVILIVKAEDSESARSSVNEFLESYRDSRVYDWYVIGGRWSGTLSLDKFDKTIMKAFNEEYDKLGLAWVGGANTQEVQDKKAIELSKKYFPNQGLVPGIARNRYNREGYADDIVPLVECIETVREWSEEYKDRKKEIKEEIKKKVLAGEEIEDYVLYIAGKTAYDDFSFESNVFNITEGGFLIPESKEEMEGYYAVMIDMHN